MLESVVPGLSELVLRLRVEVASGVNDRGELALLPLLMLLLLLILLLLLVLPARFLGVPQLFMLLVLSLLLKVLGIL